MGLAYRCSMAPSLKVVKSIKAMTKSDIAQSLAEGLELKKSQGSKLLVDLAELAAREVKRTGKFVIPGVCMLKTRVKPATMAGKREVFGKVMMVKANPARTVVKAFPAASLKKLV